MTTSEHDYHRSFTPWLMWGLGASYFFIMYIARVSPGVMSFELMQDFHVNALELGSLVAFFYFPYVAMQIPVGIIIDKFGPRLVLPITLTLCCIAALLFSQAQSLSSASISRLLLGFGSSFAFVGALKLASTWFPPHRIGLLAGLTQAIGMLGASVGEHPVAVSVSTIGWRNSVLWMSGLFIILAIIIRLVVKDKPDHSHFEPLHNEENQTIWKGVRSVLGNPQSWIGGIFAGLLFAPTAAFAELWGNSFLRTTYGLSMETAAFGVGLIFIGWGIGGPLMGWISDKVGKRKPFMFLSAALCCVFLTAALYLHLPKPLLYTCLFLYGITNTGVILAYALVAETNQRRLAGTSLGVANMLSIMLGTLFQPLIGWFLDVLGGMTIVNNLPQYESGDFQIAMTILPLCLLMGFFLAFFIKETYCKPYEERVTLNK